MIFYRRQRIISPFLIISSLVISAFALEIARIQPQVPTLSKHHADLKSVASIAKNNYKLPSVAAARSVESTTNGQRYGYPYQVAPTLTPIKNSRSDDSEAVISKAKSYGGKLAAPEEFVKKSGKKYKIPETYEATRRRGEDTIERRLRTYQEPKYRNFEELESEFQPRRIDIGVPYSEYGYPSKSRRPLVSPRDPYLSNEPTDGFYPTVPKIKSYSSHYAQRGRDTPHYNSGHYEDTHSYHDDHSYEDEYEKNSYTSHPKYPPSEGHYNYHKDYEIESNQPIMGDIRKRLLDYAGASDMYESEPDYLQELTRKKYKFGPAANDYYAYGGPEYKRTYRDFPYVETKITLVKKLRP